MHSHPYPGLAIIAACLVTLTACRPVPDTTPDPARSSTLAAESVHTELADAPPPSFRMPPPGPFDPNAPGFEPFKPCEDIPDEFLAGLGITKDPKGPDSYEPYACSIHIDAVEGPGLFALIAYPLSLQQLTANGPLRVSTEQAARLNGSAVLGSPEFFTDYYCLSGVETPAGFIAVDYSGWPNTPSGSTLCEVPTKIIEQLYGVEK
ncbi:DUF3558 family protein [Corynebacterium lizhenjunii]|uniref:DUF3558 family protein n=1 Tax=Corynebacterium lizhenjunii TaxID=2709394 RepID=A0A7T0KG61_9CORY|nr:DUF3558 family protein [Corynebacterium lizhenjunii]QPK80183.1 DUF3558 family protein [Corynebacterium lizhenjunii]